MKNIVLLSFIILSGCKNNSNNHTLDYYYSPTLFVPNQLDSIAKIRRLTTSYYLRPININENIKGAKSMDIKLINYKKNKMSISYSDDSMIIFDLIISKNTISFFLEQHTYYDCSDDSIICKIRNETCYINNYIKENSPCLKLECGVYRYYKLSISGVKPKKIVIDAKMVMLR